MNISRSYAAQIARETAQIARDGVYSDATGRSHDIGAPIENSVARTQIYAPDWTPPALGAPKFETRIEVTNETTLNAARRLFDENRDMAALNFASATSVGGGWLNGARAQEEFLCRNSILAECLENQREFYDYHRQTHGAPRYSSAMIYSPDVPVIRAENDDLRAPWPCTFITAAAPNFNTGLTMPLAELRDLWRERIARVFDIALAHQHDSLVLGAWGCGAFKNDPQLVAQAFADTIEKYDGQFELLLFAVLDIDNKQGNCRTFARYLQK